jgi:hypothetical protein
MKRWAFILAGIVIGLSVLTYVAGLFIPRDHVAAMSIDLNKDPSTIWSMISDFGSTAKWRTDVSAVRMDPPVDGKVRFTESGGQGSVQFEVVSQQPPFRQSVRVVDDDQPFGGVWTWQLEPLEGGSAPKTRLTITEAGFIKSPIFRTMGKFFFSPTDTIESYLTALAKALGDNASPPRHVR